MLVTHFIFLVLGEKFNFKTSATVDFSQYWQTVSMKKSFVFSVTACKSAHVVLSEIPGIIGPDTLAVEIGSLNDQNTTLYKVAGNQVMEGATSPGILSCNEMKTLWISWDGRLEVGKGPYPGSSQMLTAALPTGYEVNAISISTNGNVGTWSFHQPQGTLFIESL